MGEHNRSGHKLFGLIACIAKHDALISSSLLGSALPFSCSGIDPLSNIAGLSSQLIRNKYLISVKDIIIIGVTNFTDRFTDHIFVIKLRSGGNLSSNGYAIAFYKSLASYSTVWVLRQACIQYTVGNGVRNFIGVAFANGFRGENE